MSKIIIQNETLKKAFLEKGFNNLTEIQNLVLNKKNLGTGYSFIKGLEKAKNSHVLMLNSGIYLRLLNIFKILKISIRLCDLSTNAK